MNYSHLSEIERDELCRLQSEGKSVREIGRILGRSHSTLVRELKRNRHKPPWGARVYLPHTAQRKAKMRLQEGHRRLRLKSMDMRLEVLRLLEIGWSPEIIAGRLKRVRPELPSISHEAIYQWIYSQRRDLIRYLARAHRKRLPRRSALKHRVRILDRRSIRERPPEATDRSQAGHWETDLMIMKGRSVLQVSVERQSRYSLLRKLPGRTASVCRAGLTQSFTALPDHLRRSLTYDNGLENAEHHVLNEDFGMDSYFCEPYHSWEKGTVENTNGLIRRFLPRQHVLEQCPEERIAKLQDWLNDRPRRILNYQTPREVFQTLGALKR